MAAVISRGETQMRALVKDLLDLSRVEADDLELEIEKVDVRDVIGSSLESMNPIFDAKFQTVTYNTSPEFISLEGDRIRLNQVMTNLLSNASKYSPEGSNVEVKTYLNDSIFGIEISDDGIGISPEDQLQLFTPFFRSENSETRQVSGNGLGLVICKQIVELHGGELTVNSTRGSGTTVRVELPLSKPVSDSADAA
jgi:signal transduction histidine kinase